MAEFDLERYKARVAARIAQLESAGMSAQIPDAARKVGSLKRGPRVDSIADLATALKWTMGQALGLVDPTLFLDRERRIDPTTTAVIIEVLRRSGRYEGAPAAMLGDAISWLYSALSEHEEAGDGFSVEAAMPLLESLLRHAALKESGSNS